MADVSALAGLVGSLLGSIIFLVVGIGLSVALYFIAVKLLDKNPIYGMAASLLGIFCCPVGVVVPIIIFVKAAKNNSKETQRQFAIMSALAQDPSDEKIDEFMARADSEGGVIGNDPQNWNAFRNLWFAVNGSPNVTTEKKNIFCMWLSSKGLILSAQQAKIIDNYKPNN